MQPLNYKEEGDGDVLILIHGFPMNLHVWDSFQEKLSADFRVIALDLPGFGKSEALPTGFSIENVADTVLNFIEEKRYTHPVVVGHSLGGYVTLAMAEKDPGALGGFCLFHSTALPDSQEKKQSRNKVLEFIQKQGVQAFTSNFIAQLHADPQHSSVTRVKNIAVESSAETVMGYTAAMRDRKDRRHVLRSFPRPILLLAGEKDQGIPPSTVFEQADLNTYAAAIVLPGVAHMGMFESETTCLKKISAFAKKCAVTF